MWGGASKGQTEPVPFCWGRHKASSWWQVCEGSKRGEASLLEWSGAVPIMPAPLQGRHRECHGAVPLLIPLPPATDALSPEGYALQHNQHRPSCCCTGPGVPSCCWGVQGRCSGHCAVPVTSPKTPLSLPAAGLVERYNGPQKPRSLPGPQEDVGEEAIEAERRGKTWSKEKGTIS